MKQWRKQLDERRKGWREEKGRMEGRKEANKKEHGRETRLK